ncbi:LOW QUALITY PROTEIN: sodium/potassium/calcium exchanger 2-like [Clytia hemisphaerica]
MTTDLKQYSKTYHPMTSSSSSSGKHRRYKRRQTHIFIKLVCITVTLTTVLVFLTLYKYLDSKQSKWRSNQQLVSKLHDDSYQSRKLLNVNNETTTTKAPVIPQGIGDYPKDLFTVEQKKNGWIALHVIGVLYMFLALAIICDEFFVPALHVISSILKISDDVAGATFMAAGGSAPELFTSIIGVFFSDSQVGFGTIVGSAVFNVLFVIGMCAMCSKTLLELTWWPLLRDSIFYIIALILLIIFFSDSSISWHESLGLFLVYIAYVIFMIKNSSIEMAVKAYISKKTRASSVTPIIDEKNENGFLSLPSMFSKNSFRNGAIQLVIHTLDPIAEAGVDDKLQKIKDHYDTISTDQQKGLSTSLLDEKELTSPNQSETTILHDDYNSQRGPSETSVAHSRISHGKEEIEMMERNNQNNSTEAINGHATKPVPNNDAKNHPNSTQDSRPNSVASLFNDNDVNQNNGDTVNRNGVGMIDDASRRNSVRFSSRRLSRCSSRASCRSHRGLAPVKKESPVEDIKDPEDGEGEDTGDEEEEEEGPVDLSWPDEIFERIFYVIKAPLLFVMVLTVPDVRRPKFKKLFPLTFTLSIVWIAVFSYLMLWWASEIGRAAGIDVEIMGLTFIAAGTSIPDLITSVVVARQGLGDMAVSSSIGSNIFDVTVGLPLPWLAYSMSKSFKDVVVKNSGLFCSTILLFLMLVAVVITIALSKWRMTKMLGGIMFGLYVVFITLTLLLQLDVFACPFG